MFRFLYTGVEDWNVDLIRGSDWHVAFRLRLVGPCTEVSGVCVRERWREPLSVSESGSRAVRFDAMNLFRVACFSWMMLSPPGQLPGPAAVNY